MSNNVQRATVGLDLRSKGYRYIRNVGVGTYGSIELVQDVGSRQQLAVKMMDRLAAGNNPKLIQQIANEKALWPAMLHKHLVELQKTFEKSSRVYFVMEYLGEGNLGEWLNQNGVPGAALGKNLMTQMLKGVRFMHGLDISHRDLKPENILMLAGGTQLKICDFGAAVLCGDGKLCQDIVGTPPYLAPELIDGVKYHPKKVDSWALGVIFHELITGNLPFPTAGNPQVMRAEQTALALAWRQLNGFDPATQQGLTRIFSIQSSDRPTVAAIQLMDFIH